MERNTSLNALVSYTDQDITSLQRNGLSFDDIISIVFILTALIVILKKRKDKIHQKEEENNNKGEELD